MGCSRRFADFALGRAIGAGADDDQARATVSLTVDFPAGRRARATGSKRARGSSAVGGTLSFADVSLTVEGREIVRARAVFVVAG